MTHDERTVVIGDPAELTKAGTRRRFLRALGLGGTLVLLPSVFAACDDDDELIGGGGQNGGPVVLNLNTDIGIFNYAYALEQLESAFYSQVVGLGNFNALFTNEAEREVLVDVRNDEVVHREFYRTALGTARIPDLQVNFGNALANRQSILETARTFEDLGVAAYNGAGRFLRNADNLLVAGKIVSVEARHAAAIRDILDPTGGRAFADLTTLTQLGADVATARDGALAPAQVLTAADPFITTPISIGTQPS
jgi:hypothetical protein